MRIKVVERGLKTGLFVAVLETFRNVPLPP